MTNHFMPCSFTVSRLYDKPFYVMLTFSIQALGHAFPALLTFTTLALCFAAFRLLTHPLATSLSFLSFHLFLVTAISFSRVRFTSCLFQSPASVTTILENANMYHTIDDRDIYTNLDNAEVPPSYSVIATSDPSLERYPYAEVPPTAYSYRNGNLSSPNKAGFSPTGYAHLGRQPFAPAFSYPDRYYQDQEPQQQQPPIPRPRVEGEIDTSNTAKVNDIRLRYERSSSLNSRSSNRSATNI